MTNSINETRIEQIITFLKSLNIKSKRFIKIIIGNKGQRLKAIGKTARNDIEALLGCRVMLNTWVKVKNGWSDDERILKSLGYDDGF